MPRLDNSDAEVIKRLELDFDENDPGRTQPVDLCTDCYLLGYYDMAECDHPPYDEQFPAYVCRECGEQLTGDDD